MENKKVEEKMLKDVSGGNGTELHDLVFAIGDADPNANVYDADSAAAYLNSKFGIQLSWDTLDKNIYTDANGNRISHDDVMKLVEKG
ncbi:MAG: hypothetical protein IJ201_03575 [Solobacterium sp.]|nr:hypothetical protein [Solobacterium sp.]